MVRSISKNRIVRDVFEKLAPLYDWLEPWLHFHRGRRWRQRAIVVSELKNPQRLLDACCGTGLMSAELAQAFPGSTHIVAVDFSPAMVNCAKLQLRDSGAARRVELKVENVEVLPFPDAFFDGAFIAFGLRFVSDVESVLRECYRVLEPGATLVTLELGKPSTALRRCWSSFMREYFIPAWARVRQGLPKVLTYHVQDAVKHFPDPQALGRMMLRAGFGGVEYELLDSGLATIHRARKLIKE
jgi:demethylmenaquinone methyltransferase/2-methoxy-6-polyprenyl-1,4-benzoquinol methylase